MAGYLLDSLLSKNGPSFVHRVTSRFRGMPRIQIEYRSEFNYWKNNCLKSNGSRTGYQIVKAAWTNWRPAIQFSNLKLHGSDKSA
jgi:hypothetical protein